MLTTDCNTSFDLSWKSFDEICDRSSTSQREEGNRKGNGMGGGEGGVVPYTKHQKLVSFAPCKLP